MNEQTPSPSEADCIKWHIPAYDSHVDDTFNEKEMKREDASENM